MGCRILALALVAALAAACTSAPPRTTTGPSTPLPLTTPTSLPTSPSTSPSPTRTGPLTTGPNVRPGEKPPEFPDLARQHTADGALAFAIYYFKAFDWGLATNDPYLVERISDPRCRGCQRYINSLHRLTARHQTLRGGRISFNSASIYYGHLRIAANYAVDVAVTQGPVTITQAGAPPSRASRRDTNDHSLVFVDWRGGRWVVVEVTAR